MTTDSRLVAARFTIDDAQRAADEWRFNCGPAALAAVSQLTPEEVRPLMGDFECRGFTNPTLMFQCLKNCGLDWQKRKDTEWPAFGLCRVQWEGPWMAPGVPIRARYRHTHWVAADTLDGEVWIFDVNCMCVGGWVPLAEWRDSVVPWLLKECEPEATGVWHLTHTIEIQRPKL